MQNLILLSLVCFISFQYQSPAAMAATDEWKLEQKKKGIAVYSQKTPGGKYKKIKSITTMDADINTVISIYKDFKNYPKWQNFMEEIKVVGSLDEDNLFAYAVYDFPWPISNRDIVIKTELESTGDEKKSVVLKITSASHPDFPEKDNTIRIKDYNCSAFLEEIDSERTKVTYIIEADPGGNMPALCVNLAAKEAQFLTLSNLKKLVRKKMTATSIE